MHGYHSIHLEGTETFRHVADGGNHVSLHIDGDRLGSLSLVLPHHLGHAANATLLQALADEAHTLAVACDELAAGTGSPSRNGGDECEEFDTPAEEILAVLDAGEPVEFGIQLHPSFHLYEPTSTVVERAELTELLEGEL